MKPRSDSLAKWIGLLVGLTLAGALVLSFRTPASSSTLGADLKLVATPPGELTVEPPGALLSARKLEPGDEVQGSLRIRNLTGSNQAVRFRALPSSRDLDRAVRVELRAGSRVLARETLGGLRSWTRRAVTVPRGDTRDVVASVSIPERVRDGYEGRMVDVTVELQARDAR